MYRARFADGVVYGVSHIQALLNALGAIQGQHDAEVNGL